MISYEEYGHGQHLQTNARMRVISDTYVRPRNASSLILKGGRPNMKTFATYPSYHFDVRDTANRTVMNFAGNEGTAPSRFAPPTKLYCGPPCT
jgi:hypothetical protein